MQDSQRILWSVALTAALCAACVLGAGCASAQSEDARVITLEQRHALEAMDALLPLLPDSIAAVYETYDRPSFYLAHAGRIDTLLLLLDSLNACLPRLQRFDSLVIDHAPAFFGMAGRVHRTFAVSSSYFFLYNDAAVLRAVAFHEVGHALYDALHEQQRVQVAQLWDTLGRASMLYLFTDGEYSHNPRFGGHPYDNPSELFASTFNLLHNNIEELDARMQYIDGPAYWLIRRLLGIVLDASLP